MERKLARRWGVVWWLRQEAALQDAQATLAAGGVSAATEFGPLEPAERQRAPYLRVRRADFGKSLRLLSEAGWTMLSRAGRWRGVTAEVARDGCHLTVGTRAPPPSPRHSVHRERLLLPWYELLARARSSRWKPVDFRGAIRIGPGVFAPHDWTLELVEAVIARTQNPPARVIDVGTGSGALALALADAWAETHVLGIDISARAIACARANARMRRTSNVRFELGDLLSGPNAHSADMVIAVLPFLPALFKLAGDQNPDPWLGPHETVTDDSSDGLYQVRQLVQESGSVLEPGGTLVLELLPEQVRLIARELEARGFDTEQHEVFVIATLRRA